MKDIQWSAQSGNFARYVPEYSGAGSFFDLNSMTSGVFDTAVAAGFSLHDPRTASPVARLFNRAARSAYVGTYVMRVLHTDPPFESAPKALTPKVKAVCAVAGAGLAWLSAPLEDRLDTNLRNFLEPKLGKFGTQLLFTGVIAGSTAGVWLAARGLENQEIRELSQPVTQELPAGWRELFAAILNATDEYDAPVLRTHLENARVVSYSAAELESLNYLDFDIAPEAQAQRTSIHSFTFPVVASFTDDAGTEWKVALRVEDGSLESASVIQADDLFPALDGAENPGETEVSGGDAADKHGDDNGEDMAETWQLPGFPSVDRVTFKRQTVTGYITFDPLQR